MATHLMQQFGSVSASRTVCGLSLRTARATRVLAEVSCRECRNRVVVASPLTPLHVVKHYDTGIGHIEQCKDGVYLVSFYGTRVTQAHVSTLQTARFVLRKMAL